MVSLTSEGGPQVVEMHSTAGNGVGMKPEDLKTGMTSENSMTESTPSGGASMTSGSLKRGPPINNSPAAEIPLKRPKLGDGYSRPASDSQLASTVFKKFVNSALDEKTSGNNRTYLELRRKFMADPFETDAPSSLELRQTISALTHTVSRLDKSYTQLVLDIINTAWAGRDNLFFKAYMRLIGNLVSAHSTYIPLVTKMLVHHLALNSSRMCTLPNHPPVTRDVIYDRTHAVLEYIMELVPTAAHSTLFPALVAEFPNKAEKRLAQTTYLSNLLRVVEYAPALRSKVLAMVIERIIKIDIEIQADIEDLPEDEGDDLKRELDNAEEEDGESDTSSDSADYDEDIGQTSVQRIKETVDKLDSMLEIMFEFFSHFLPTQIQPEELPTTESQTIFENLLESFDKTILPTYQSRYTQFVMFWAVQKSPKFIDIFLGELIGCAVDNNKSQVLRQAAAAYVASFVARAKMMDKASVRAVVTVLCNWMQLYLVKREGDCSGPDIGKFGAFYSVFQAVMYIFCFRWKDLRQEQGERWIPPLLVMQRAIVSKFNPLKVCSPGVVTEFARISNFLNFLYCFTIIEKNQRSLLGHSSSHSTQPGSFVRSQPGRIALEAYFPFDPYNLRRSKKWVESYYVEWERIPGLDPDSDEEDGDDDDDDDDDEESDDNGVSGDEGDEDEEEDDESSDEEIDEKEV
ncbi:RNA polymerase I-specific transcription initiation factor RRN3-domain-containing protein [Kalaharituber pfeilii]|nr:RNA polymerase I-specific transcription initiation factor RRN3-domain-containing protein [Kalaharituber pfeilii]